MADKFNYELYLETIKNSVTIRQLINHYNLSINRAGFAKCPFHNDSKPSMKINEGSDNYTHCFVCNKSWDVIEFVKDYENISFKEALENLNIMFNLNLGNKKLSKEQIKKIQYRKKMRIEKEKQIKLFNEFKNKIAFEISNKYNENINTYIKMYPKTKRDITDNFFKAVKLRDYYDNLYSYIYELGDTRFECFYKSSDFIKKIKEGSINVDGLL